MAWVSARVVRALARRKNSLIFPPHRLDRTEVRAVGRQRFERGSRLGQQVFRPGALMRLQIVPDHDIVRPQVGHQKSLHPEAEAGPVQWAVQFHRGARPLPTLGLDQRGGVPVVGRHIVIDPLAHRGASVKGRQGGLHPQFVLKNQSSGINFRHRAMPLRAFGLHLGRVPFAGVQVFLFAPQPQLLQVLADGLLAHRGAAGLAQLLQRGVGPLLDRGDQALLVFGRHFGWGTAAGGQGGECAGLVQALEEQANPARADTEDRGDGCAGTPAFEAGTDHALTQIIGIGFHGPDLLSVASIPMIPLAAQSFLKWYNSTAHAAHIVPLMVCLTLPTPNCQNIPVREQGLGVNQVNSRPPRCIQRPHGMPTTCPRWIMDAGLSLSGGGARWFYSVPGSGPRSRRLRPGTFFTSLSGAGVITATRTMSREGTSGQGRASQFSGRSAWALRP